MTKNVTFGAVKSSDYGLILTDCEITPPDLKTTIVDIPGRQGSLDLSEALCGRVYEDREITCSFSRKGGAKDTATVQAIEEFVQKVHGKHLDHITIDGFDGYYSGRCACDVDYGFGRTDVTVKITAYPYRQKDVTLDPITFTDSYAGTFENKAAPAYLKITSTAAFHIVMNGVDTALGAVTDYQSSIRLEPGNNDYSLTASDECTVTFSYTIGVL